MLTLTAVALLITGLEEAAARLAWKNTHVIGPLCASGIAWVLLACSQWHSSRPDSTTQPVFPWHFCKNRIVMGLLVYVIPFALVFVAPSLT